jgi:hypothetical protein
MNIPNNIMSYFDTKRQPKNLFAATLSIFKPGIIDFVGKAKFTTGNESLFDEKTDYYVYTNITSQQGSDNIYSTPLNISNALGPDNIYSDYVVTNYIPFISNCEGLGSHITFKNLLEQPQCNLLDKEKTTTFKFTDIFAVATGDNCDYTTTCFYDENFDSSKDNWMQFDYGLSQDPLMNISKYSLDSETFNKYVNDFTISVPDGLNIKNTTKFMEMIPLYIDTEVTRLKSQLSKAIYIPRNIQFTILYYTTEEGDRTIVRAEFKLTDFEELASKNNIEIEYPKMFPYPANRAPVNSTIYKFFKNQYESQYMGISNFIRQNLYANTTQFRKYFPDYFQYKELSSEIKQLLFSEFNSSGTDITHLADEDLDPQKLIIFFKQALVENLAKQASARNLEQPTILPNQPNVTTDLPENILNEFKDAYKTYYFNAYILNKHFYNFRVVIRPATWLEALNYNVFPLYSYVLVAVILLSAIFALYLLYYIIYKLGCCRSIFRLTINKFNESKFEKLKFWEDYKAQHSSFYTIKELFKNNIYANLIISLPVYIFVIGFLFLFYYPDIFMRIPSTIREKPQDYNDPSDPDVNLMLKRNKLARYALVMLALSFFTFYLGVLLLTPEHEHELIKEKLVTPHEVKQRNGRRWSLVKPLFFTILMLTVMLISISNFFNLSGLYQIISAVFYQLVICTFIQNLFDKKTVISSIVISLLDISIYDLIFESTDFNTMLCLFLVYQFIKYFKILFNQSLNRLFTYLIKKCIRRNYEKRLLAKEDSDDKALSQDPNEDKETAVLSENMITLNEVSTYICNNFITIPFICFKLLILYLTPGTNQTTIFNTTTLLIFMSILFVIDAINFWLLLKTSAIKDGKIIYKSRLVWNEFSFH